MTIHPVAPPHLLTVAEYLRIVLRLAIQLEQQLPTDLEAIPDMDVDLQLAPPEAPGSVRRPDLVVVSRGARLRVRHAGGVLRASDVVVAIEVLSAGSQRTDHAHKRGEYAEAGIGHYWIVDIVEPVSLLACHLAGEFGYYDDGAVTDRVTTRAPFAVTLDLNSLL